jgi:polyhydroxyalkanoate synthase
MKANYNKEILSHGEDSSRSSDKNIFSDFNDLFLDYLSKQTAEIESSGIHQTFLDLSLELWNKPEKVLENQQKAMSSLYELWGNSFDNILSTETDKQQPKKVADKRFKHKAWNDSPYFELIKKSYLLTDNTLYAMENEIDYLDENTAKKAAFYTRQFIDAMSPANFIATNPEVIESTIQSNGTNLLKGFENFCNDFNSESGQLRIKMADLNAFDLGTNIAISPGKIVFENELMQLIQYSPTTEKVFKRPLLIIPPWINKFYILDLQPKNSFIKWLTEQGHTVFIISWVNPDASHREKDFSDYVFQGPMAALDAISKATDEDEVNVIGYCIGGTLLSATLAYMHAKEDKRIVAASFLTSLIDFSEPGDLGVFIDESQISDLEKKMNSQGFHEGKDMALSFNLLRANDLIWSFYINNYLLGKSPQKFDLLYWNSDSTRMPAKMHSTYLRKMYLENIFKEPGGISIGDIQIDVSTIETPSYFISTEDDHIAPWKSTYLGAQLLSGPTRFVLGKSGHIAGIVNHPDAMKYGYYTGPSPKDNADSWYTKTKSHEGSWWLDWQKWFISVAGDEKVSARIVGSGGLASLEDAPGSYVRVKC